MLLNTNHITPPWFQFNGHLQTIIPSVFRKVNDINYIRERIPTPDNDFLDLDWSFNQGRKLAIISHGLEGSTDRAYVKGMVRAFNREPWDVLAWNYRGCSGEVNRQLRFYHSGATDDLGIVVAHALSKRRYDEISLIGFSLGGNLTLKYLGEQGRSINSCIAKAVVFSVPLDLLGSCLQLARGLNTMYSYRFLRKLKQKVRLKAQHHPQAFDLRHLARVTELMQFDDAYTAPLHGFNGAVDYYQKCSAKQFLKEITVPTLIINAKNDPFLSDSCYPYRELKQHPLVKLFIPDLGGHVGFRNNNKNWPYRSEEIAWNFLNAG